MVATTFAADTPLVVTGMVARYGIAGNWLWWNMAASGMLTVFFFARLWRRAGVMTDVEFAELRYAGKPAAFLRGFRALYLGIPINCIIIGWVNLAMLKILQVTLGLDATRRAVGAARAADLHRVLHHARRIVGRAGHRPRAVRAQDGDGRRARLLRGARGRRPRRARDEGRARSMRRPAAARGSRFFRPTDSAWMPAITLFVYLGVSWWASWYPGRRAGRRRLRRAAHLLGEDRARRPARDALVQHRALRGAPVAVDHHRARVARALSRCSSTRNPATCGR